MLASVSMRRIITIKKYLNQPNATQQQRAHTRRDYKHDPIKRLSKRTSVCLKVRSSSGDLPDISVKLQSM